MMVIEAVLLNPGRAEGLGQSSQDTAVNWQCGGLWGQRDLRKVRRTNF